MVELARRSFITGLIAFGVTAPAIVRAGSLMPVKQMIWSSDEIADLLSRRLDSYAGQRDDRLYTRCRATYDAVRREWVDLQLTAEQQAAVARVFANG